MIVWCGRITAAFSYSRNGRGNNLAQRLNIQHEPYEKHAVTPPVILDSLYKYVTWTIVGSSAEHHALEHGLQE